MSRRSSIESNWIGSLWVHKYMNEQQIIQLIHQIVDPKISDVLKKSNSFIKKRVFDPVTDINSPITGSSQQIGFFNTPKIAQPIVSGSKASNAALTSLCIALANLGLITNSTT